MGVYKGVDVKYKYDWEKWWTITLHKARDFYKTGMDETNITSITPIPRVPKLLPVGTKVRVFEEFDSYHSKDEFVIQETYIWNYHSPSSSSYIRLVLPFMYEDAKLPKEKVMNWFNQQTSREKTEL